MARVRIRVNGRDNISGCCVTDMVELSVPQSRPPWDPLNGSSFVA